MVLIFFYISTSFRFSEISVECPVHSCACPWLIWFSHLDEEEACSWWCINLTSIVAIRRFHSSRFSRNLVKILLWLTGSSTRKKETIVKIILGNLKDPSIEIPESRWNWTKKPRKLNIWILASSLGPNLKTKKFCGN